MCKNTGIAGFFRLSETAVHTMFVHVLYKFTT